MARNIPGITGSNNKWHATAYDPEVGRKVRVKNPRTGTTSFRSQEDAIDAKENFERRKNNTERRWTVREWAQEWTTNPVYLKPAETTNMHNVSQIRAFIAEFGDVALEDLTTKMIREWAYANTHRIPQVRNMLNDARREELLRDNPFSRIKVAQSKGRRDIKPLTEPEVADLVQIAYDLYPDWPVMGAFIKTAAYTGMRLGEICGLRWEDVDWEGGMLHVERQVTKTKKLTPPKNGEDRKIVMLGHVADTLRDLPRLNADGFVFYSRRDKKRMNQNLNHYFWTAVRSAFFARLSPERQKEVGPSIDFHELRHFCGSYLADRGVSAMDIAYQLGHTDGGILAQRLYIHTYDDHAAERIRRAGHVSGQRSGRTGS